MKVTFRRTLYGDSAAHGRRFLAPVSPTDTDKVRIEGEIEFCCGGMKTAWREDDIIGFGPCYNWTQIPEDAIAVNIYQRVYEDSYEWYPIKFCPFCGEAIEYDEAPALTQVKRIEEVPAIPAKERVTYESVLVGNRDKSEES